MSLIEKIAEKFKPEHSSNVAFAAKALLMVGLMSMPFSFLAGAGVAFFLGTSIEAGAMMGPVVAGGLSVLGTTIIAVPHLVCAACHKIVHRNDPKPVKTTDADGEEAVRKKPSFIARKIKNIFAKSSQKTVEADAPKPKNTVDPSAPRSNAF